MGTEQLVRLSDSTTRHFSLSRCGVVDNKTPSLIGNDTVFTHNLHTTSFILQTTSPRFGIHISGIMRASPISPTFILKHHNK